MSVIAIISDTHLPRGARRIPDTCLRRLADADLIVHAGDLIRLEVLHQLEALGPVAAVHGNVDEPDLRQLLPATRILTAPEGSRLAVIHDAGRAPGRLARMRARFPDADAVIFGHSHVPLHEQDPAGGFQIFNPGSPTDRRRAPEHTMGLARVGEEGIRFELIGLG